VRFTTASDMLAELAAQDSSSILARRLRRYTTQLLCIDEVGYLSYNSRCADLLFEVVTRRYDAQKPVLLSTNKAFSEWSEVFPHAACVVTLVDRLIHLAEVIDIEADRLVSSRLIARIRAISAISAATSSTSFLAATRFSSQLRSSSRSGAYGDVGVCLFDALKARQSHFEEEKSCGTGAAGLVLYFEHHAGLLPRPALALRGSFLGSPPPNRCEGGDGGAILVGSVVEVRPEVLDVDAVVRGGAAAHARDALEQVELPGAAVDPVSKLLGQVGQRLHAVR